MLDRVAQPDDVRRAVHRLRDAGIDNISLDLIYGIPGQEPADLAARPRRGPGARARAPLRVRAGGEAGHTLHARPRSRAASVRPRRWSRISSRSSSALTGAGYRWYETANFCLRAERAGGRDLRARHNLGYWLGHDYLGLGVGAVSTIENRRWRNAPSLPRYLAALDAGSAPPREVEELPAERRRDGAGDARPAPRRAARARRPRATCSTPRELGRLSELGLVSRGGGHARLTPRGRFLGGGVTARLLA